MFVQRISAIFFLSLAAFLSTTSFSAAQDYHLKIYTTREGLAGDYITAVAFEPNNSAWVGTSEGATHISDAGWVSYTRAHGLGDGFITSIAVAPDARVWLGTSSGGIAVINLGFKRVTTYTLESSDIPSNFITAVAIDPDNRVWVGTLDNGVARYDVTADKWTQFDFPEREITAIALDGDNAPWVGTPNGVYHLDGANWLLDKNVGDANVKRIDAFDGEWYLTVDSVSDGSNGDARFVLQNDHWVANDGADEIADALNTANIQEAQITAFGKDTQHRYWLGTPRGIFMVHKGNAPNPPKPYPVVLVHGWTVAGDDTLETSEFRFLTSYGDRDGIPMYYAQGVSPQNTLYQNAAVIRDEIARVKKETGADKVNLMGFSMGGMNTRAYLETSLYGDDVNRAIILGTPQAGVDVWKPILMQQILEKPDEPSAIELSPEYAQQVVNRTRMPNPIVPYDLLIGDARKQTGLDFLHDMPASDALISVSSALALDLWQGRYHVNSDLHDWGPEAVPLDLTSYLYPRESWERYLRNALRNSDNDAIGSEVLRDGYWTPPVEYLQNDGTAPGNHTPIINTELHANETLSHTLQIDENTSARFIAYYPNGQVEFSLIAPDGKKYEPSDLPHAENGVLSLSTDIASFSGYVVKDAPVGEWQLILKRTDDGATPLDVSTYIELAAPLKLNAFTPFQLLDVGATNTITGVVTVNSGEALRNLKMTARVAQPAANFAEPFTISEIELFDDGKHNDGAANDGFFANDFTPARGGWYPVFVKAEGKDFARESEMLFAANRGGATRVQKPDWKYLPKSGAESKTLQVTTNVNVERAGRYGISATLLKYGLEPIAREFVPVTLEAGTHPITITFDTKVLPKAATSSPQSLELDLTLLDLDWAAVPIQYVERATNVWR